MFANHFYDASMNFKLETSLTRVLLTQTARYKYIYILALISLVITYYIQSLLPFWAKELADLVDTDKVSIWKFILLAIGIIIFRTSSRLLFFYPARVFQKDARDELVQRVEKALPSRYSHYSAGQLFQVIHNDLDPVRALMGFVFLQVGGTIIAMAILLPKLAAFNSSLVIALLPMMISVIIFSIIMWKNKIFFRKAADLQGDVQNFIIESFNGKRTVKTFQSESSFIGLFREYSFKELMNFYKGRVGVSICMPLVPLGMGLSLLMGAYFIKTYDLGASSLILFSGFLFLFLEPIMFLSWIGVVLAQSNAAWGRVAELLTALETPSEEELLLNKRTLRDENGFSLPFWDHELNFELIESGIPVLIGKTGCGKSQMLLKIAQILSKAGKSISVVSQSPYLYNDTILNNIFLGNESDQEQRDQAYHLLRLFALDELGAKRDDLLELEVGENGVRLSGGQAKRICLVRSLMSDASCLLWDDPFSSVDVILEKEIMISLRSSAWLNDRRLIFATHRYSTLKSCHQVILLDQKIGISESGFVDELLKSKESKVYEYFKDQMV